MELHSIFAHISWTLLFGILYMRPLADILKNSFLQKALRYRKYFGILCGFAALAHVALYLIIYDLLNIYVTDSAFWKFTNLFGWGNIALFTLLIPFLTSNRISQRYLKKRWKILQKFSYLALIFTGIHISLVGQNILYGIGPVLVWLLLWLWSWKLKQG